MAGAGMLVAARAAQTVRGALNTMEGEDMPFQFKRDMHSDIKLDRWTEDPEDASQGRAVIEGIFGLMSRSKNPLGRYFGSIDAQNAQAREEMLRNFYASRVGDENVTELEKMQEYYISKSLGDNAVRPQPHPLQQLTHSYMKDGKRYTRQVFRQGSETKGGEGIPDVRASYAELLEGRRIIMGRQTVRTLAEDPDYFRSLWDQALKDDSIETILSGGGGVNSVAGNLLKNFLSYLTVAPQDGEIGELGWGETQQELIELHHMIMGSILEDSKLRLDKHTRSGGSSGYTNEELKAQDELSLREKAAIDMKIGGGEAPPPPMTRAETTRANEDFGEGLIPAIGQGVTRGGIAALDWAGDMAMQPIRTLSKSLTEGRTKLLSKEYNERQPRPGSSTSIADERRMTEKYGPPESRPTRSILRGIKNYAQDFLFGGNMRSTSFTDDNVTSPSHADFAALDVALMTKYSPTQLLTMSPQQKQEAFEGLESRERESTGYNDGKPRGYLSRSAQAAPARAIRGAMSMMGDVASATAGGIAAKIDSPFSTLGDSMRSGMAKMRTQEWKDRQAPLGTSMTPARERELLEQYGPKEGRSLRVFQGLLARFNKMLKGGPDDIRFSEIDAILLTSFSPEQVLEMTDEEKANAYMEMAR